MERTPARTRLPASRPRFPTLTAMPTIDLNADLGEGGSQDAALMTIVSSANIACGGHAGDEETMRAAIKAALAAGVAVGAHPGYEDRENFGRRPMNLPPTEVTEMVTRQLDGFTNLATESGAKVHHVKPHGALYNQANIDPTLAAAVAEAVQLILPGCGFYVPPGGALALAGKAVGLAVMAEGFVDRRYQDNGSLVPRGEPGAVIEVPACAIAQALPIAIEQRVKTLNGHWISLPAKTLCVHGDTPAAVDLLGQVRHALEQAGFTIRAC